MNGMTNSGTQKMNVMFVVPCFGFGGLERVVLDLIKGLDRSRFNPSLCSLLNPHPEMIGVMRDLGVATYVLDKGAGVNYILPFRLSSLFLRDHADIVNAHDIGATLYSVAAARLAGIGKVVHVEHSQILTKHRFMPVYRWVFRHGITRAIAVSEDLRRYLCTTFALSEALVTTIPNGIDVAPFVAPLGESSPHRELGIREGERVVGCVGRLTEQKGTEYLLRAFAVLARRRSDVKLVIVGDGELRHDLERLADRLQIGNRVVFTGIRKDVPNLMRLFDVFALPSLWEGQPITIVEAMAAGTPVVATDVGGNAEILHHGEFGVLVPPRDENALAEAIGALLSDASRAGTLGSKAASHAARELTSASMVKKYEDVFVATEAACRAGHSRHP
jgi:glycosyltransferase involved in cell wall biosynthesis